MPKSIKGQLDSEAGGGRANGRGHAEVAALRYIQKNNWTSLGGAANRGICAFCENAIRDSVGELALVSVERESSCLANSEIPIADGLG
jgi:hypothetical protein